MDDHHTTNDPGQYRGRDASSLGIIGAFFVVLALLVMCGTFFGEARFAARAVNLGAGGILILIGVGMVFSAWRIRPPGKQSKAKR